jgi:hypothetical protein
VLEEVNARCSSASTKSHRGQSRRQRSVARSRLRPGGNVTDEAQVQALVNAAEESSAASTY